MNPREFAERCLLGVLMSQPARVTPISRWLAADDFRSPAHGTIYAHLTEMVAEARRDHGADLADAAGTLPGVDPVTLYERIARSGELGTHEITAPRLHTLLATAPPPHLARPESYGVMVLEASIRRRLAEGGIRVQQHVDQATDIADLLDAVEAALTDVDAAQQRWDTVTGTTRLARALDPAPDPAQIPGPRAGGDRQLIERVMLQPPDEQQLQCAEEAVVAAVLTRPAMLEQLNERLLPKDFADERLANAYRCALELHARGEHIDMVTVAWEQQRHEHAHGPGLAPEEMLALADRVVGDPGYHVDIVMCGSVTRLTRSAAEAVQKAAQHPSLQPADVLHTTRLAYTAVRDTAARMYGQASTAARLAGLSAPVPVGTALEQHDPDSPGRFPLSVGPPLVNDRGR